MSDNNNDDLEGAFDEGDDSGFDDFGSQGTLGDLWRNNPLVKVGVIFGSFALVVGGIMLFGDSGTSGPRSRVNKASEVAEAPATGDVSQAYREAIEEENTERVEAALKGNKSALPTPIEPPKGMVPLTEEEEPEEDPLERWRRLQEARKAQAVIPQRTEPETPTVDPRAAQVNAISEQMFAQMQSVLEAQEPQESDIRTITKITWLTDLEHAAAQQQEAAAAAAGAGASDDNLLQGEIIVEQGSLVYGQLLLEANTDAPGPVLAQVVTGPYAGSRMLGTFSATENYLVLKFDSIVIDGVGYSTEAFAIDPGTSLPGLATEVDHRYFRRAVLPMAAAFVEGLAEAISESGNTTITVSASGSSTSSEQSDKTKDQEVASGIAEAGKELGEILDDEADSIVPMIRVAAGTPVGILFVEPVIRETE